MFSIADCFLLGYVVKTHGRQGEIIARLDTDNPEKYYRPESILVRMHKNVAQLVPFFVTDSLPMHNKQIRWQLEGVDSLTKASELAGKEIYLPLSRLPKLSGNKFYHHEIIGFDVIDKEYGNIGHVTQVFDYPAQAVLEIKDNGKTILIPVIDDCILHVQRTKKELHVQTPPGLVEMYRNA